MNELSREASQLVYAGREAFRPTEAERARLMVAITGAATLTAGLAAATGAQRAWGIFNLTQAARWLAVALPVATVGAVGWHVMASSPAEAPARLTAIRPAATLVSAAAGVSALPAAPAAPVLPDSPAPAAAPSERLSSPAVETTRDKEIRREVALLSQAQTALSSGRPQAALAALSEHARRFPRGVLTEERVATRARTLCALGRVQEAQAELNRMEKLNPTSAYLARARESCTSR